MQASSRAVALNQNVLSRRWFSFGEIYLVLNETRHARHAHQT